MLTDEELFNKCRSDKPITCEDIGIPSWRNDCDGFYYELNNLFCRGGIAYKHKNGYRWSNGDYLTKRECKIYGFELGVMNN